MAGTEYSDRQADCFSFSGYHYDAASGVATLSYDVDGQTLQEKITFPWAPWPVDASRQAALFQALELLHLVAGISYYKAGLARRIDTGESRIDGVVAGFLNTLYLQGLGEFAYVNQLDLSGLINFEVNIDETPGVNDLDLPARALVAMGGGKDSLVCLQMLRSAGVEVQPVCVGGSALIGETVKAAGLPLIRIQRVLAPELVEMNAKGAWNGHVPVTAINSAILLCASLLYGHRYIVFANESSANEATLKDAQGKEINHQYSKSFAFEQAFRAVIHSRVSAGIEYFSLLRPFSEMPSPGGLFSEMTEFHDVFSSCNRNFHWMVHILRAAGARIVPSAGSRPWRWHPFLSPAAVESQFRVQTCWIRENQLRVSGPCAGSGAQSHLSVWAVLPRAVLRMKFLATSPEWQHRDCQHAGRICGDQAKCELELLEPDPAAEHCIPCAIMAKIKCVSVTWKTPVLQSWARAGRVRLCGVRFARRFPDKPLYLVCRIRRLMTGFLHANSIPQLTHAIQVRWTVDQA